MHPPTERETNELRAVLLAYLETCEHEPGPELADWIRQHPQHSEDLARFAVYQHVVEGPAHTAQEGEILASASLAIEQVALDQAFAGLVEPAPLTSLVARARSLNGSPESLAASLNLGVDIILKLERRVLVAESIPGDLVERLAAHLYCGVAQLRAFLAETAAQPAPAFYHAQQPPATGGQQTFAEAVRESRMMREEQKKLWLRCEII